MTDQRREAFEAWHGGRYLGIQALIAESAWQAATVAERERAAPLIKALLSSRELLAAFEGCSRNNFANLALEEIAAIDSAIRQPLPTGTGVNHG